MATITLFNPLTDEIFPVNTAGFDARFVNITGDVMTGDLTIQPAVNSATALRVNQADGTNILTVDTINKAFEIIGATSLIADTATSIPLLVKGAAGQTANLLELQDSGGNVLSGVDERGILFSDGNTVPTNLIIGQDAGNTIMTGGENVYLGDLTGVHTTTGQRNVTLGSNAGEFITIGSQNMFLGDNAGRGTNANKVTGSNNVAIGSGALSLVFSGTSNMAIGGNSLRSITTQNQNTAIGYGTGELITAARNTLIGYFAGRLQTTATQCTFIGWTAGGAGTVTGNANTGIGDNALRVISSGASNVVIGAGAGMALTTGGSNIFLGNAAGDKQTALSNLLIVDNQTRADVVTEITNSIIYGVMAAAPASQTLRVNASVGIGVTPAISAWLELSSTTGALLLTRMTTVQRDALTAVNGMVLYNTNNNRLEAYENGAWVDL